MQNNLWYNKKVAAKFEKKDQPLALRVPISLLNTIEEISEAEDRPVGYVARELMVRGLALYQRDGMLRDAQSENGRANLEPATVVMAKDLGELTDETKDVARRKKA